MNSAGSLSQQPARITPFRSNSSVVQPKSQAPSRALCSSQHGRSGTKLCALSERSAVNAATLETTETDLSAELKDVLSKVQPKVCTQELETRESTEQELPCCLYNSVDHCTVLICLFVD